MKAAIIGIGGLSLADDEAALIRAHAPLGVILFGRNIADPGQLADLMVALRAVLPSDHVVMVDQEGGRVARLRPPHWRAHPPAAAIGVLAARDRDAGIRAAFLHGALIGAECGQNGFSLVAAPVLDRHVAGSHDVIGDRAFSADARLAGRLARAMAEGLLAAGVMPIGKHAPGHGRARVDSHLALPILADVDDDDLTPFIANAWLPWLMTAHIRYVAVDAEHPATLSGAMIERVIRGRIGFGGVLVSDDLAMNALSGDAGARAGRAVAAGCDVALHCSGELAETASVLAAVPRITAATSARLARAQAMAQRAARPLELAAMLDERAALLGLVV